MDRMRSLADKNLKKFFIYTFFVLLVCSPILFLLMEKFYAKDLDELIEYRRDEFIETQLGHFTFADIEQWNRYNEDVVILPFDSKYPLGTLRQEEDFSKAEGHNIDYRVLYHQIVIEGLPYVLMVRIPMVENHDLLVTLVTQYGVLFLLLLLVLSVVFHHMSKKLWRPFYKSLNMIESFSLESGVVPDFEETDTIEFKRLNDILTDLLSKDIQIYKSQKKFIENASHELQTPLAILQSKLDIFLQEPMLTELQVAEIHSFYQIISRMTRLNKNLLLLARIENAQYEERQTIDFIKMLYDQLSLLHYFADSKGINISSEIKSKLEVEGNPTLLESLINNLIVNAIRHNIDQGVIEIEVDAGIFIVRNTGQPSALNPNRIYNRFNRTSGEIEGNGLGLSIVSQICNLHHWKIDYEYKGGMHGFCVRFT